MGDMSSILEEEGRWTQCKPWLQYPKGVECLVIFIAAVSCYSVTCWSHMLMRNTGFCEYHALVTAKPHPYLRIIFRRHPV